MRSREDTAINGIGTCVLLPAQGTVASTPRNIALDIREGLDVCVPSGW